jgi:hypothetical protein
MSQNNGLHDRIRAALREAPEGLTLRELTIKVRGEVGERDNAISCALRRLHVVTQDIVSVPLPGRRLRYYLVGKEPVNQDVVHLLTMPWAGQVGPLVEDLLAAPRPEFPQHHDSGHDSR